MDTLKCKYIFGRQQFIGFVKFFDQKKNFGYIVSNNYGMEKHPKFMSISQNFYFDNSSLLEGVHFVSGLVVFQPAWVDKKLKAINIRKFNIDKDRKLALSYYYNQNFINFTTKKTIFHRYKSNEEIILDHKVNILLQSGICRYELINEYSSQYRIKGDKYLIWAINKLVHAAGGDEEYYHTLNGKYGNREKEEIALKNLFESLENSTIVDIVSQHPCLQKFVPEDILGKNIQLLKEEYGIPQTLYQQFKCEFCITL